MFWPIAVALLGITIIIAGFILTRQPRTGDTVAPMFCNWCFTELHYPVCVWKDRPICVSCLQKEHR